MTTGAGHAEHAEHAGRRLVLLRHAKAEPAGHIADEQRPLSLVGRRQCAAVGARLAAAGLAPHQVVVSSALRTRQTWDLVRGALGAVPDRAVHVTDRLYEARAADVVELVAGLDEEVRTVLMIGHEPTMSQTARLLAARDDDGENQELVAQIRTGLPTAGYVVLQVSGWATLTPGSARLSSIVRPSG